MSFRKAMESSKQAPSFDERNIHLGIPGFRYGDLYAPEKLKELQSIFQERLKPLGLYHKYVDYLKEGLENYAQEGDLLIEIGEQVGPFIAEIFGIQSELKRLNKSYTATKRLFEFKNSIVKKEIVKLEKLKTPAPAHRKTLSALFKACVEILKIEKKPSQEEVVADTVLEIYDRLRVYKKAKQAPNAVGPATREWVNHLHLSLSAVFPFELKDAIESEATFITKVFEQLVLYCYIIYLEQKELPKEHRWPSFHLPKPLAFDHLLETEPSPAGGIYGPKQFLRRRDGFKLTDPRMSDTQVASEIDYCVLCHSRKKDSCSKGLHEKDGRIKKSPSGIPLTGCPLNEKISEAHTLASKGNPLGALAIIMVDNPMCPGTGHRICNDCMRGCIYQKQEPVNIPQVETHLLTDILYKLPYGFEIYGLLTRWNPLNRRGLYSLPYNGKNILIIGQGPAGYTLAHYLSSQGFGVVGLDGLKIEPLADPLTGADIGIPLPIKDYKKELYVETDERILMGFGGVSEYGITVRWDKNFLNIIYLTLARKKLYRVYGGVRFGGTLTIEDAWDLGFDHIAMATGAGKPTIIPMKNNLINGIRKASDFLMTLQLTGAAKKDSLASLQLRLPAVVIGGGLTGVDTATEIFAYYPVLVEKVLERYEILEKNGALETLRERMSSYDKQVLQEYLEHGRAVCLERKRAKEAGEKPNFVPLIRKWGGVKLVYRKATSDSPAYRLNYEEVEKALEEGIEFLDGYSPLEAVPDDYGSIKALVLEKQAKDEQGRWQATGQSVTMPVRSLCIAAGTAPNTIYEKERPGTFKKDKWDYYFSTHQASFEHGTSPQLKEGEGFFSSYLENGKTISFYGDNHPHYAGNVVKAMASAKDGYPQIVKLFEKNQMDTHPAKQTERDQAWQEMTEKLDDAFNAVVHEVKRLTPTIVEVIIKAPYAAKKFQPGQFYRVQRYESYSPKIENIRLATEGMALTGAWTDPKRGLMSTIVLEMGHSSRLCADFKPGEKIVCMGPTGEPTVIPENETVLLVGGGLGNAVLFSIAEACRKKNNKVIYFAGYKNAHDLFKLEELKRSTDVLVVCCDRSKPMETGRQTDYVFKGNIVEAMIAYGSGRLGDQPVKMQDVNRLIVIGSDQMMAAVKHARCHQLKDILPEDHIAYGSINSPMQCMMKEICAQCLQKHIHPQTGKEEYVFSCFNQDQHLDKVDFPNLNQRLQGNMVLEKLNNAYLSYIFKKHPELKLV